MAGIFKAYDIRGVYGDTLTDELAEQIARAFATFLKPKTVVVGRDMRPHSTPLFEAIARGLTRQGAEVIDLGLCSTPMCYHACGQLNADASIMITASHNPAPWNGLKLTRAQAIPISGATGIMDIERIVADAAFDAPAPDPGRITRHDILPRYRELIAGRADVRRPLRVACDIANAMGAVEARALEGLIELDVLFGEMDGTFPNHEANPLKAETLTALRQKVRSGAYAFGAAFDGDADRAGFVDEQGAIIPMDMITALIAKDLLAKEKGVIFYDLRSSLAVKEIIAEQGGTPMRSRVGHAFIKQQMRDHDALFAGELSGHYYFRDNYYTESAALAILCVANIVSRSNQPLSELIAPMQRYHASGEINSEVGDPQAVLSMIKQEYADGHLFELDGISVEYNDWWFNVRLSNTEPLVRLNLEASTAEAMQAKRDEVLAKIRRFA